MVKATELTGTTTADPGNPTPTRLHNPASRGFASDNCAGVHSEILTALALSNGGHEASYGEDAYTKRLQGVMAHHFGPDTEAFPVFNGTGANVLSLQSMLPRWGAVICAATSHINIDENAAPERVGGIKLLTIDTPDGKLTPELIAQEAWGWGIEHRAQPLVVSITQSTERGTVYTPSEIQAIADFAHARGITLHMDGARLANAAAHLNVPLRAITRDVGVDVLSFGGTKNGIILGETIVLLTKEASAGLKYLRKMNMQLASKMRFVSAQIIALMEGDLWLRSAQQSNSMAKRLSEAVREIPGIKLTQEVQSNAVFATMPPAAASKARERVRFLDWNPVRGEVRWMCSFDTMPEDVDNLVAILQESVGSCQNEIHSVGEPAIVS
ncbi:threonine aldolase family protein [Arthrobacter cupressi]|uniref:L-threonine aldolase n=1 Tax=Arthrobacter cupressi TaxID=1045773 RepID=A0A1G8YRG9_9MICC|nr:low specificity L-threonine aldolase [Arthrobacter cupressi]NYD79633.1 threonine aldolase [Arthrobacter cupressi]SDK05391.1 L-threonine aldolase [Arthrobacter cupressi]